MNKARLNALPVKCTLCGHERVVQISPYPNEKRLFLSASSLVQCMQCRIVFAFPMPGKKELDDYYANGINYRGVEPEGKDFFDFSVKLAGTRLKLILENYRGKSSGRLLDIGAGNGAMGYALKEMSNGFAYDAVEPSEGVSSRYGDWVQNVYRWLGDAPRKTYSVISLCQVLEHVRDPAAFLKEVSGHLLDDGIIFIDVPHRDELYKPSVEQHLYFWEKQSLEYAVREAGLLSLFCEPAGMKYKRAEKYFVKSSLLKTALYPWMWKDLMNAVFLKLGLRIKLDTFGKFKAETYGPGRQWLRCVAVKAV